MQLSKKISIITKKEKLIIQLTLQLPSTRSNTINTAIILDSDNTDDAVIVRKSPIKKIKFKNN